MLKSNYYKSFIDIIISIINISIIIIMLEHSLRDDTQGQRQNCCHSTPGNTPSTWLGWEGGLAQNLVPALRAVGKLEWDEDFCPESIYSRVWCSVLGMQALVLGAFKRVNSGSYLGRTGPADPAGTSSGTTAHGKRASAHKTGTVQVMQAYTGIFCITFIYVS